MWILFCMCSNSVVVSTDWLPFHINIYAIRFYLIINMIYVMSIEYRVWCMDDFVVLLAITNILLCSLFIIRWRCDAIVNVNAVTAHKLATSWVPFCHCACWQIDAIMANHRRWCSVCYIIDWMKHIYMLMTGWWDKNASDAANKHDCKI